MEVDTWPAVTIMAESSFVLDLSQESMINLIVYTLKWKIQVKDEATCEYESKHYIFPIVVTSGSAPTLLGRTWLQHIPLNWSKLIQAILKVDNKFSQLLQSFNDVFI